MPYVHTYYEYFIHYTLKFVMDPSIWLLEVIGYEVELVDLRIISVAEPPFSLIMQNPCLGTDMMFAFAALVISFPGKIVDRMWFLPLGWVGIELVNILRVVGLSLVWLNIGSDGSIDHHDLFNFFTTLFVLGMFLFWVWLYKKRYK